MGKFENIYEPQPECNLIRVTYVGFDFARKVYPSWYSVIRGTRMSCHYHLHQNMEIIYVEEGRVSFQVSGRQYELFENDILLINSFEPHSAAIPPDCDKTVYYAINVDMNQLGNLPNKLIKSIADDLINGNGIYPNIPESEDTKAELLQCVREIVGGRTEAKELYQLAGLCRTFAVLGSPMPVECEKESKRSDQFIISTISYIQNTPLQEVSLEAIAELLCYNKAYFTTLFKKNFGMSFTDYLNNYKINLAKTYIRNGNYNLNDVAEKSGFNYYAYFFKRFKIITGISPSEYVDQCRAASNRSDLK
jgi:AraC-like DNA-binding protein